MSFRHFTLGTALALGGTLAMAQTESVTAYARIVSSATAVPTHNGLNFERFTRPTTGNGTITLRPDGSILPAGTGVICNGIPRPGRVRITGGVGLNYTLSLPTGDVTLTRTGLPGAATADQRLTLNGFTLDPATPSSGAISGAGVMDLNYGAVLHLTNTSEEGAYTGTYQVTITFS